MGRILVVDDEKSIRITLKAFLSEAGYDIQVTENADGAVSILNEMEFDVVICDVIMPKVSGMDLLKAIGKLSPQPKVIMMTGQPTIETAAESLRSGAFDYLTKPVTKDMVLKVVRNALNVRNLENAKEQLEKEKRKYQKNLEKLVEDRTEKLKKALEGIVHVTSKTVEMRDPYTAGHQMRVAELAFAIATELNLPAKQSEGIQMAGIIHDLGKISVPAEILVKPGQLTENEFRIIKEHPQIGFEILKTVTFPWPMAKIVQQHHERIDGSGYPNGLSGDDILIEAKILAIADVVEAMASHRPYRPSLGIDAALEEISNNSNLYDTAAVEKCIYLFQEKKFKFVN